MMAGVGPQLAYQAVLMGAMFDKVEPNAKWFGLLEEVSLLLWAVSLLVSPTLSGPAHDGCHPVGQPDMAQVPSRVLLQVPDCRLFTPVHDERLC